MALMGVLTKIFGSKNDRELKRLRPYVEQINALEPAMKALSDEALKAKTPEFKKRIGEYAKQHGFEIATGTKDQVNAALWSILPEAFAVCREASFRVLEMRHYDVQLIGGMALHDGKISEMKTGEGKTLVATLPLYLNALAGRGAHLVTVNDYLAKRDAEWMGRLYNWLGLSIGIVLANDHGSAAKQAAYNADITYGQNNEFGFDYLRDNMKFTLSEYVQRELFFAIVDEVDSILIDEARTPLIISGPTEDSTDKYVIVNAIIPSLKREIDYTVDEKARSVMLTEDGIAAVEKKMQVDNLYDPANIEILHHVNQGLRAHVMFKRDVDYVIDQGEVKIVDEFTGRIMDGRRWSDGLHQAIEAKEGVKVENENQTLATITFQNYFRMYKKLGGMTGTADTEAAEFAKTYNLDVMIIPTHRTNVRQDEQDIIYLTEKEKFELIVQEIQTRQAKGQPVLVGTASVEKSEVLGRMLKRAGVPHHVLNAKYHAMEAEIVAQAGRRGAVTIATNMAGRGTDILLGGNAEFLARQEVGDAPHVEMLIARGTEPAEAQKLAAEWQAKFSASLAKFKAQCKIEHEEVVRVGGLHILGTERHESRRIDNQLRGRAGRQGDPGSSRFYLSLEDDLIRIFGGDRMKNLMQRFGMKPGEVIEHPWVTKSIENAQKRVEAHNFDIRKNVLEYDDVMNLQRKAVYSLRREVLGGTLENLREKVLDLIEEGIIVATNTRCPASMPIEKWDLRALEADVKALFEIEVSLAGLSDLSRESIENHLFTQVEKELVKKETAINPQVLRQVERAVYLGSIDSYWKDHLLQMDHLKEGIHLRGYGQKDPKQEYKKEGFNLFSNMMSRMQADVLFKLFHVTITADSPQEYSAMLEQRQPQKLIEKHDEVDGMSMDVPASVGMPPVSAQAQARMQAQARAAAEMSAAHQQAHQPEPVKIETYRRERPKIGRNDPCYCNSGKKYKQCHLPEDEASDKGQRVG